MTDICKTCGATSEEAAATLHYLRYSVILHCGTCGAWWNFQRNIQYAPIQQRKTFGWIIPLFGFMCLMTILIIEGMKI